MKTSTKILATILIIVNFLLAHYIVSSLPIRIDLTKENIFSLSKNSKNLLSLIEDPVELDFYYSRSAEDLPIRFKNFAERVEQMLVEYKKAANGRIRLNIIDPQPDTPEEAAATAVGLHGQQLPSGDSVFLGLAAIQGDIERAIPFFDWNKEGLLEYDVSKLIYETQVLAKPRLAIVTSLPLKAPDYPAMPGQPQPQNQHIIDELETGFQVEMVEETATELPDDTDMVAIIHPQNISEALLYSIDQHALSGKPLFVAVDPSSRTNKNQSQQMGGMMGRPNPNESSTLDTFFSAWGIEYDATQAVADPQIALTQPNFIEPSWLVMNEETRNNSFNPITNLEATLIVEAGSLKLAEGSEATFEPVLKSTTEAGTVSSMILNFTREGALLRQIEAKGEELTIAGMLTGTLKSAFPDGPPSTSESEEEEVETADASEHLTEGEASVFIIADTDWLMDGFSVRRMNFLGMPAVQPLNDNANMASNIIDFLGGSKDLIGIRGKGSTNRAFDVVQNLELKAQQAYQAKLQEVEDQLSTIQQKIQEIASQQQGSGLIVATPELQEILKKNQEEQARLQGERREIRRELRSDIESLGSLLLWSNRLYAPFALLIIGILFFKSRKQRSF